MNVIEVLDLTKDYRQHFWTPIRRVLSGVSFSVEQGEIFGFLGPNGSGKSTTIKILLEIIFATGGSARLFEKPLGDLSVKRRVGFLPENPYFYDYLTSTEFLMFHGELSGLKRSHLTRRIAEVIELVGMKGTEHLQLRSFSKGMLQRIGLAQSILHDPDLVILDEPMTGLDPVGRKEVRDLMLTLRDQGKTVFFSTHILSDVETLCDRVAMLNKGRLLSCGSLGELVSVEMKYLDMIWSQPSEAFMTYLNGLSGVQVRVSMNQVYLKATPMSGETSDALEIRGRAIVSEGLKMNQKLVMFSPKKENLEDVFMRQVSNMGDRV